MEIIDKFNNLIEEEKYAEALPVIYDIIDMNPDISTSWFNLGICLQNLEDYPQGAGAFQQACLDMSMKMTGMVMVRLSSVWLFV